jgi:hypothetical protein
MDKFQLKTKGGEVINNVYAVSVGEASDMFAKIKDLPISDLLRLFNVVVEANI